MLKVCELEATQNELVFKPSISLLVNNLVRSHVALVAHMYIQS